MGWCDSVFPGETTDCVFLDLSFEFVANIVVQDRYYKSMRLECKDKVTQQHIWAFTGSLLETQICWFPEIVPQSSVLKILRLVDEILERMEELNIISGDFQTVPVQVVDS